MSKRKNVESIHITMDRKELYNGERRTWGVLNPVTRAVPAKKGKGSYKRHSKHKKTQYDY